MNAVRPGRFAARPDADVTVFLIGMRVNSFAALPRWVPVAAAMRPMLQHLAAHPESGFLGQHSWFGRTTIMLSYWRSAADLQRFAADADAPHLEPWRRFMKAARNDSSVGIWHETYVVPAGGHESIYAHLPEFGLGKAVGSLPVGRDLHTARARLAAATAPSAP